MRTAIAQALMAKVNAANLFNYTAFDYVRLQGGDFKDYELPASQVIDLGDSNVHEQSRGKKTWNLAIEIIVGPTAEVPVNQETLWNLMQATERAIFDGDPLTLIDKTGLEMGSSVIQTMLVGSSTDLHFMQPYYLGRIEIAVEYYQPLVRPC